MDDRHGLTIAAALREAAFSVALQAAALILATVTVTLVLAGAVLLSSGLLPPLSSTTLPGCPDRGRGIPHERPPCIILDAASRIPGPT